MPVADDDDPFAELRLDDEFVRAAQTRELSAEDRVRRAERLARQEQDILARQKAERRERRPHRRLARVVRGRIPNKGVVIVVVVLALAWWFAFGGLDRIGIHLGGDKSEKSSATDAGDELPEVTSGQPTTEPVDPAAQRPTPKSGSAAPLGAPAPKPAQRGPYKFVGVQPGSAAPITYDPCREITVVVNNRTLPRGAENVVEAALAEVSVATGLQFRVESATNETPSIDRATFQPDRYGDRWAPVLIAWSDPDESPRLAGDVGGYAGSRYVHDAVTDTWAYVTGSVTLDGPELGRLTKLKKGTEYIQAVVTHELGHLVGLDHVDSRASLMYPSAQIDVTHFAPGDLHGLAELGTGACIPSL